jgi:GTP-binding protein
MTLRKRDDLRNLAIVAHVDHGKTTLVDAMLHQSGAFRANEAVADRVMDSMDLEREKGITILAKNTSLVWRDERDGSDITLNIVDTPGHADFGGEVERALTMVDGIVLLVDAAEGPLPQTRFVLRKALARDLPVILVINKVDRPDARTEAVVDEVYELFFDLEASEHQIDFPIVYCSGRDGWSTLDLAEAEAGNNEAGSDEGVRGAAGLRSLAEVLVDTIPAPTYHEGAPLQAWVTNLDASPYLGRLALLRIFEGTLRKGQSVAWCRIDGTVVRARIAELFLTEHLDRVPVDEAHQGDLVAVAGIDDVTIGETLADLDDPRPLPVISVDEPERLVGFLSHLLPNRRRSEIWSSIGFRKHAKTERYRDLAAYLRTSDTRFDYAPGTPGLVMIVFTMEGYDVVFKVVRDRFPPQKKVTPYDVALRYRIVARHDRGGRLVEAQRFVDLRLPSHRFEPKLIKELTSEASRNVTVTGAEITFKTVYVERRVTPLDMFLRTAEDEEAARAIIDYGSAIKNLAASNIFPGDMLLKNFGVSGRGRVVFYDYDEICKLTDCKFRRFPSDPYDDFAATPTYGVGPNDIFPEELPRFLGLSPDLRAVLDEHHADLFDTEFWQAVQNRLESGEVIEILPYSRSRSLV